MVDWMAALKELWSVGQMVSMSAVWRVVWKGVSLAASKEGCSAGQKVALLGMC